MKAVAMCMVAIIVGVLCVWSCRKTGSPVGPPFAQSGYFPNKVGSFWVYEVYDSVSGHLYEKTVRIVDSLQLGDMALSVWTVCDSARCDSLFIGIKQDTVWKYFLPADTSAEIFYILPLDVGRTWPRLRGRDSVVSLETISVRDRVYRAYEVHGIWGGLNVYEQERRWFVPYVGMVKRHYSCHGFCYDNELWELKQHSLP